MGYRLLGYVCIGGGGQNTTAQVPSLLNGCSSMTGRREEGGEDGGQNVCVRVCVYPRLFYSVAHRPLFHSPLPSVRTIMQGESPFSPQGGVGDGKEVAGHWDKGALCW